VARFTEPCRAPVKGREPSAPTELGLPATPDHRARALAKAGARGHFSDAHLRGGLIADPSTSLHCSAAGAGEACAHDHPTRSRIDALEFASVVGRNPAPPGTTCQER
jgi:hypothetical protein